MDFRLNKPNIPPRRTMEKKLYQTPQLHCIGSVQELTAATSPPVCGSADDFTSVDEVCVIEQPL